MNRAPRTGLVLALGVLVLGGCSTPTGATADGAARPGPLGRRQPRLPTP